MRSSLELQVFFIYRMEMTACRHWEQRTHKLNSHRHLSLCPFAFFPELSVCFSLHVFHFTLLKSLLHSLRASGDSSEGSFHVCAWKYLLTVYEMKIFIQPFAFEFRRRVLRILLHSLIWLGNLHSRNDSRVCEKVWVSLISHLFIRRR